MSAATVFFAPCIKFGEAWSAEDVPIADSMTPIFSGFASGPLRGQWKTVQVDASNKLSAANTLEAIAKLFAPLVLEGIRTAATTLKASPGFNAFGDKERNEQYLASALSVIPGCPGIALITGLYAEAKEVVAYRLPHMSRRLLEDAQNVDRVRGDMQKAHRAALCSLRTIFGSHCSLTSIATTTTAALFIKSYYTLALIASRGNIESLAKHGLIPLNPVEPSGAGAGAGAGSGVSRLADRYVCVDIPSCIRAQLWIQEKSVFGSLWRHIVTKTTPENVEHTILKCFSTIGKADLEKEPIRAPLQGIHTDNTPLNIANIVSVEAGSVVVDNGAGKSPFKMGLLVVDDGVLIELSTLSSCILKHTNPVAQITIEQCKHHRSNTGGIPTPCIKGSEVDDDCLTFLSAQGPAVARIDGVFYEYECKRDNNITLCKANESVIRNVRHVWMQSDLGWWKLKRVASPNRGWIAFERGSDRVFSHSGARLQNTTPIFVCKQGEGSVVFPISCHTMKTSRDVSYEVDRHYMQHNGLAVGSILWPLRSITDTLSIACSSSDIPRDWIEKLGVLELELKAAVEKSRPDSIDSLDTVLALISDDRVVGQVTTVQPDTRVTESSYTSSRGRIEMDVGGRDTINVRLKVCARPWNLDELERRIGHALGWLVDSNVDVVLAGLARVRSAVQALKAMGVGSDFRGTLDGMHATHGEYNDAVLVLGALSIARSLTDIKIGDPVIAHICPCGTSTTDTTVGVGLRSVAACLRAELGLCHTENLCIHNDGPLPFAFDVTRAVLAALKVASRLLTRWNEPRNPAAEGIVQCVCNGDTCVDAILLFTHMLQGEVHIHNLLEAETLSEALRTTSTSIFQSIKRVRGTTTFRLALQELRACTNEFGATHLVLVLATIGCIDHVALSLTNPAVLNDGDMVIYPTFVRKLRVWEFSSPEVETLQKVASSFADDSFDVSQGVKGVTSLLLEAKRLMRDPGTVFMTGNAHLRDEWCLLSHKEAALPDNSDESLFLTASPQIASIVNDNTRTCYRLAVAFFYSVAEEAGVSETTGSAVARKQAAAIALLDRVSILIANPRASENEDKPWKTLGRASSKRVECATTALLLAAALHAIQLFSCPRVAASRTLAIWRQLITAVNMSDGTGDQLFPGPESTRKWSKTLKKQLKGCEKVEGSRVKTKTDVDIVTTMRNRALAPCTFRVHTDTRFNSAIELLGIFPNKASRTWIEHAANGVHGFVLSTLPEIEIKLDTITSESAILPTDVVECIESVKLTGCVLSSVPNMVTEPLPYALFRMHQRVTQSTATLPYACLSVDGSYCVVNTSRAAVHIRRLDYVSVDEIKFKIKSQTHTPPITPYEVDVSVQRVSRLTLTRSSVGVRQAEGRHDVVYKVTPGSPENALEECEKALPKTSDVWVLLYALCTTNVSAGLINDSGVVNSVLLSNTEPLTNVVGSLNSATGGIPSIAIPWFCARDRLPVQTPPSLTTDVPEQGLWMQYAPMMRASHELVARTRRTTRELDVIESDAESIRAFVSVCLSGVNGVAMDAFGRDISVSTILQSKELRDRLRSGCKQEFNSWAPALDDIRALMQMFGREKHRETIQKCVSMIVATQYPLSCEPFLFYKALLNAWQEDVRDPKALRDISALDLLQASGNEPGALGAASGSSETGASAVEELTDYFVNYQAKQENILDMGSASSVIQESVVYPYLKLDGNAIVSQLLRNEPFVRVKSRAESRWSSGGKSRYIVEETKSGKRVSLTDDGSELHNGNIEVEEKRTNQGLGEVGHLSIQVIDNPRTSQAIALSAAIILPSTEINVIVKTKSTVALDSEIERLHDEWSTSFAKAALHIADSGTADPPNPGRSYEVLLDARDIIAHLRTLYVRDRRPGTLAVASGVGNHFRTLMFAKAIAATELQMEQACDSSRFSGSEISRKVMSILTGIDVVRTGLVKEGEESPLPILSSAVSLNAAVETAIKRSGAVRTRAPDTVAREMSHMFMGCVLGSVKFVVHSGVRAGRPVTKGQRHYNDKPENSTKASKSEFPLEVPAERTSEIKKETQIKNRVTGIEIDILRHIIDATPMLRNNAFMAKLAYGHAVVQARVVQLIASLAKFRNVLVRNDTESKGRKGKLSATEKCIKNAVSALARCVLTGKVTNLKPSAAGAAHRGEEAATPTIAAAIDTFVSELVAWVTKITDLADEQVTQLALLKPAMNTLSSEVCLHEGCRKTRVFSDTSDKWQFMAIVPMLRVRTGSSGVTNQYLCPGHPEARSSGRTAKYVESVLLDHGRFDWMKLVTVFDSIGEKGSRKRIDVTPLVNQLTGVRAESCYSTKQLEYVNDLHAAACTRISWKPFEVSGDSGTLVVPTFTRESILRYDTKDSERVMMYVADKIFPFRETR